MEREEFRTLLVDARDDLERLLELSRAGAAPVALDTSIGRLTRVDALQQQSMALATRGAHELRLKQVVAALGRFERGTYGDCLGCGEPIAEARLRVRPEATLCVECQSARERRG